MLEESKFHSFNRSQICPISSENLICSQIETWLNYHQYCNVIKSKKLVHQSWITIKCVHVGDVEEKLNYLKYPLGNRYWNNNSIVPIKNLIPCPRHYKPRLVFFFTQFSLWLRLILQTIYVLKMEILHFLSSKSAAYKRERLQIESGLWWRAYGRRLS